MSFFSKPSLVLFPLRVKAMPPLGDSGTPTASLLFSFMLTLLGNRHTADSGPLCFCSFCLECSPFSRYPYGSPLTSVWPLLKYHFLNGGLASGRLFKFQPHLLGAPALSSSGPLSPSDIPHTVLFYYLSLPTKTDATGAQRFLSVSFPAAIAPGPQWCLA